MMHDIQQSKIMAKALRRALAERRIDLSHSECLEIVARQFGLPDWNGLAARIDALRPSPDLPLPEGWFATGFTETARYRLGLDPQAPGVALIESRFRPDDASVPEGMRFACMMQSIAAEDYLGARIRLTATIRTEDAGAGTIWLRVDKQPGTTLAFDNMMERKADGALKGTTGWAQRSIVLAVPQDASSIHYGFFLRGCGRVFARSFRIEAAGADAATTDLPRSPPAADQRHILPQPANLDFKRRPSK